MSIHSPAGRHAVRLAVVIPLAALIARELPLQRGYWMVVAAATVLRPEFGATFTRGAERALGAVCLGVGLAGAIAVSLHPAGGATIVLVGALAWAGYSVFPASFAIGYGFITALVVFLLNVVSPDTLATATDRLRRHPGRRSDRTRRLRAVAHVGENLGLAVAGRPGRRRAHLRRQRAHCRGPGTPPGRPADAVPGAPGPAGADDRRVHGGPVAVRAEHPED